MWQTWLKYSHLVCEAYCSSYTIILIIIKFVKFARWHLRSDHKGHGHILFHSADILLGACEIRQPMISISGEMCT